MTKIKNTLLFLWRAAYPLLLYYTLVTATIVLGVTAVLTYGYASGATTPPDAVLDALNTQLSVPLTALGAVIASIPLGLMYAYFRMKQAEASERAAAEREKAEAQAALFAGLGYSETQNTPAGLVPLHQPQISQSVTQKPLPLTPRAILRIILLGFCLCVSLNALLLTLPIPWDSYEESMELLYTPSIPQQLLCVGIIVPFAEELVFRGLGYAKMRLMLRETPAILISSLYFGIYHGNLVQSIYATLLGAVLAWLMERYGGLTAPYVLHASANVMSILISNTLLGIFLAVFTLRCGLILICGGAAIFILYKIREEKLDYETIVDSHSLL